MKKIFVAFLLALFCLAMGTSAWAEVKFGATTATRDIVLEEEDEEDAGEKPVGETPGGLGVEEMRKDDFTMSLKSDKPDGVYKIGEKITLTFKSDTDAYVTVLDFTPSGQILVLFPNKWVENNFVKAGEEISIPAQGAKFSMKAGGPVGVDVIKAIATNNDVPVFDKENNDVAGPFSVIKDPKSATRDILLTEEDVDEEEEAAKAELKWSVASLAVMTTDGSDAPTGFGVAAHGDATIKAWANGTSFLVGERVFVKILSDKGGKLVSLVDEAPGKNTNNLLPENADIAFAPGEILILPRKEDKWKLVAAESVGVDTIKATVELEDGTQLELAFSINVENDE
ncbi:MAG: DUF4384 domain-containing protein [Synergistaceae bacterium]|jgi:hypothetical protein|nr:DUF4384 domain-containing protein [Synergistaceae bacterium]